MCEYSPNCSLITDPLAEPMWQRAKAENFASAVILVICPHDTHCALAAVYDDPTQDGWVVVAPHMSVLHSSWFEDPVDPNAKLHFHPALEPVANFAPGADWFGSCAHGTWAYEPSTFRKHFDDFKSRLPDDGELVWAIWPNGQRTRTTVAGAKRMGGRVDGRARLHPRHKRPFVTGSYMRMADHPDAQVTRRNDGLLRGTDC